MDRFIGNIETEIFTTFSTIHIITLLVLLISNILFVIFLRKSNREIILNYLRHFLAFFLIFNELLYIAWSIFSGSWSFEYSLPLQLCDLAVIMSAFMLLKKNYFAFELVYFWGLGGGLQALLTPDLSYPFPHIIYFNFFLGHGAVITAIIFMIIVEGFKPTFKSIGRVFLFTNVCMAVIAGINVITKGNYMFLCKKPESASIIDLLGSWPWYVLSLEAVSFVLCLVLYLPFKIRYIYTERFIQAKL